MRSVIAAILTVVVGLMVANMLGVASAEAPTTAPVRTVSVEGVANVPIAQKADLASANTVYRQGMAAAITDGQGKAEFLTGKLGGAIAAVQSIVEDGGSISCTTAGSEEGNYAEYEGEQPDFGNGPSFRPAAEAAPGVALAKPRVAHRKKKRRHAAAKKAAAVAGTCTLSAQVSLVYAID